MRGYSFLMSHRSLTSLLSKRFWLCVISVSEEFTPRLWLCMSCMQETCVWPHIL